jgi:hypothetical protein
LNLLVIDIEGYEDVIISSIDFNILKPQMIFFESQHLGNSTESVRHLLKHNDYSLLDLENDTVAFLSGIL